MSDRPPLPRLVRPLDYRISRKRRPTAGRWETADHIWAVTRIPFPLAKDHDDQHPWHIGLTISTISKAPEAFDKFRAHGLDKASFATRRDALEALALFLEIEAGSDGR